MYICVRVSVVITSTSSASFSLNNFTLDFVPLLPHFIPIHSITIFSFYCFHPFFYLRWEYYSMIYVRSNNSIRFFPRASLALFLLYHFYLFSSPSGFHLLALLVLFLFLTALMVSTLLTRTVPAICGYKFPNDKLKPFFFVLNLSHFFDKIIKTCGIPSRSVTCHNISHHII